MSDSAWQGNNGRDKSDIQPSPPRVPVTPATPQPDIKREIDRIARQLDGLSKSLRQLKQAT